MIQISINEQLLTDETKVSMGHVLQNLKDIFKDDLLKIVPQNITDPFTLNWIIKLEKKLKALESCEGFQEHIAEYKSNKTSTYFVTLLADFLFPKVDSISLEPSIIDTQKKCDIKVIINTEEIFFECKCPMENKLFNFESDHQKMFEIITQYINLPIQINIKYKKLMKEEDIHRLAKTISERLTMVSDEGAIVNNDEIQVKVIPRDPHSVQPFEMMGRLRLQEHTSNLVMPGTFFYKNGVTVMLNGPLVNYTEILKKTIKRSLSQYPDGYPFIVFISINEMIGSIEDNIVAIQSLFQPKRNTRISGVVLTKYGVGNEDDKLEFIFLPNPFSKYPVSKQIKSLLEIDN